jgi:hypothetical protein
MIWAVNLLGSIYDTSLHIIYDMSSDLTRDFVSFVMGLVK